MFSISKTKNDQKKIKMILQKNAKWAPNPSYLFTAFTNYLYFLLSSWYFTDTFELSPPSSSSLSAACALWSSNNLFSNSLIRFYFSSISFSFPCSTSVILFAYLLKLLFVVSNSSWIDAAFISAASTSFPLASPSLT